MEEGATPTPSPEEIEQENKRLRAEFKSNSFNREVRTLIKVCHDMLSEHYRLEIATSGTTPLPLAYLLKYGKVFQSSKSIPSDHYADYENFYNNYRVNILNTLINDTWLRTGKPVYLQYGSGVDALKNDERIKQVVIRISDIYRVAIQIQQKTEKLAEETDSSMVNGKDLIWGRIILLHLLRIFYYLSDDSDKNSLGKLVTELEGELGIRDLTVNKKPAKVGTATGGAAKGLSQLFSVATSFMEKIGLNVPPEAKLPDEEGLQNIIENVFNSEQTQQVIGTLTETVKNAKDANDIFSKVNESITDPNARAAFDTLTNVMKNANIPMPNNPGPVGPEQEAPTFNPKHEE
jgi:hypothetical protein